MKGSGQNANFDFVGYDGPKLPKDSKIRDLIRRRAMNHNAGIRKRNGGYDRLNTLQVPVNLLESGAGSRNTKRGPLLKSADFSDQDYQEEITVMNVTSTTSKDKSGPEDRRTPRLSPLSTWLLADLPRDYSLLQHAYPFTLLHIGLTTSSKPQSELDSIVKSYSHMPVYSQSQSYLAFIPSRYGHVSSITHITECLLATLKRKLGISTAKEDFTALKLYSKALIALQQEIDDENRRLMPETLFAIQLVGICELLSGTSDIGSWMRHVGGASRLIELRGPDSFKTDFELSLLVLHMGPIILESFVNGKACFLEQDEWQRVFQAAVHATPMLTRDQAGFIFEIGRLLSKTPRLFQETEQIISSSNISQRREIDNLKLELLHAQEDLETWLNNAEKYQYGHTQQPRHELGSSAARLLRDHKISKSSSKEEISWRIRQGTFAKCCMVVLRLRFALDPSQLPELEAECQTLAHEVVNVTQCPSAFENEKYVSFVFLSQTVGMARSIINTKDIWAGASLGTKEELMERWRFEKWCTLLGRGSMPPTVGYQI